MYLYIYVYPTYPPWSLPSPLFIPLLSRQTLFLLAFLLSSLPCSNKLEIWHRIKHCFYCIREVIGSHLLLHIVYSATISPDCSRLHQPPCTNHTREQCETIRLYCSDLYCSALDCSDLYCSALYCSDFPLFNTMKCICIPKLKNESELVGLFCAII